jgi:hypothetical protein
MRYSASALIEMLGVIVKATSGGWETIVVTPRRSMLERHSVTPVVKWEQTGERTVPMRTRMSYCEIESA